MNRNVVYVLIVGVLLLLGFIVYSQMNPAQAPVTSNGNQNNAVNANDQSSNLNQSNATTQSNAAANTNSNTRFSDETDAGGNAAVHEIAYNGSSFSPANLTVKSGDTVVFKNNGTASFWPASGPHPTHTDYLGFDSLGPVAPGKTYQFKFTRVGDWGYHDHLAPGNRGSIKVTQ